MTNQEILTQVLLGMCPYLSCGVPQPFWGLAEQLTLEMYGEAGLDILRQYHEVYQQNDEHLLHTVHGWDNEGQTEICPEELIEKLAALEGRSRTNE